MNRLRIGLSVFAMLFLISSARPVQAQTPVRVAPVFYDVADEVTVSGTVSSIVPRATLGMMPGAHLLLATPSGPIDGSLGRFGLRGAGAVSVSAGEQVEATGVMRTIGGRSVFLVRSVTANGRTYSVRNEHGVLLSPQARQRTGQKTGSNGEAQ
ncbi:MAG: hypothetical protein ABSD53_05940 [Terriglobales bacterium]